MTTGSLHSALRKGFNHVDDDMREAVLRALESRDYYLGPENDAFEREVSEYLGISHAATVNSGTSGMYLILRAYGLGEGDEVIVPAMGFVTLAEAVAVAGAKPVFVDVEEATMNLDPRRIEPAITPKTRAVVPAHKYGHPAEMDAITSIARERGLLVIEDLCHALGAEQRGRKAGTIGDAAFLSFAGKSISVCGLGGMVVTNDEELANEVRLLRDHGRPRAKGERFYDIRRIGYNMRLSELHAAIGRVQLRSLDAWNARRRENAAFYNAEFARHNLPVETPETLPGNLHAFLHYTIRVPSGLRDGLREFLKGEGVESSVLYPLDLHLLKPYRQLCDHEEGDFPTAERLTSEVLSLPNHPDITARQIARTVSLVSAFLER